MKLTKRASKKKSIKKGLLTAGAVLTGAATAVAALPHVDTITQIPIAVAIAAILGGLRAAKDYYDHARNDP